MAQLTLKANPTFVAKVGIPVAGGAPVEVEFTFNHKTVDQFKEFAERTTREKTPNLDYIMEIAIGWNLEDEFNRDNVTKLLQNYHGAPGAISFRYANELMQAKLGNS